MTYDNAGRMTSRTDQTGKITYFYYDASDNLIQTTDASGGIATFTFDKNNRLAAVKDPKNQATAITQYSYNPQNQLQSVTDPVGKIYSYGYDSKGNLSSVNDPDGYAITYGYNADNRLSEVRVGGVTKVTYSLYDSNGNLKNMTDENGTRTFAYDALNRIQSYTDSFGKSVTYGYDAAGNISTIVYPGTGKTATYTYDNDNRLWKVQDWLNTELTIYGYDASGILQSVTNPNGTTATYTYDSANRLTGLLNKQANSSEISSYYFTLLNNVGNPVTSSINQPMIPTLTAASVSYSYDDANKLTSAYTFDNRGNIATGSGNTFSFDYANRLTDASIGGINYSYLYDGFGNRIARTQGGVQTKYVLDVNGDMSDVLAETNSAGTVLNYYIYGHGLISKIDATTNQRYVYHYDTLGNTVAVTDSTGNNITEQYGYDEFGKATVGGTYSNPFRYVGKYGVMDEGNGLLFMRARYYDVENGRFISKDPIGFEGGDLNLYAYVGGNPLTGIDPEGLSEKSTAGSTPMINSSKDSRLWSIFKKSAKETGYFGCYITSLGNFCKANVGGDVQFGANVAKDLVALTPAKVIVAPVDKTLGAIGKSVSFIRGSYGLEDASWDLIKKATKLTVKEISGKELPFSNTIFFLIENRRSK